MLESTQVAAKAGPQQEVYRGGKGTPLVWLHGISPVTADDAVVNALSERFSVLAPVAPGYHDLTEIEELRDIHDLALHYDTLLDGLGLGPVALVGHSFGGMLAAEIAAHVPSRVSKLVLISPFGLWNDSYPVADLAARPYPEIDELLWQGNRHRPAHAAQSGEESQADRIERLVALANGLATFAKYTWPIPDKGLRRRLHRISAPTLLMFGESDAFVPVRYAEDFAAGIPNARTVVVPGSHMLPYEDPTETARRISEFLA